MREQPPDPRKGARDGTRPPLERVHNGADRPRCDPRDEALAAVYALPRERGNRAVEATTANAPAPLLLRFIPIGEYLSAVTAPRWLSIRSCRYGLRPPVRSRKR